MPASKGKKKNNILKRVSLMTLFFCLFTSLAFALTELPISSATASSTNGSYTAAKVIDKNLTTYWQGASNKAPYWLTLDLGKVCILNQISIWWNKSYGSTNYNIQVSSDNKTWINRLTALSSAGGTTNPYQKNHTISGSYRYVRIYINTAQSTYPIIYEVKLYADTTAPVGTIKINNGALYTNSTNVTLNLSATDLESGLSQMQFSNDGITYSTAEGYATTKAWTLTSGDGTKTVYVKYKDVAGNWSSPVSSTIILDTTVPVTSSSGIDGLYHNSAVTVTLTATDSGSGIDKTYYSIDGSNPTLVYTAPFVIGNEGIYTIKYYSKDKAGNSEAVKTSSNQVKIDKTPPVITINPVISPTNQNVILSYIVTDNLTPSNEIIVTGDNSPYTTEGTYNVTLTAKDKAGNSSTASVSFIIDRTPPVVIITSPLNGTVVENSQVQLQGTVDGVAFSEVRNLAAGENSLTKTVTDAAGNTASASINVYLYLGTSIGPAGGEVISADGKVKVIIPAGALSAAQQIKILPVSNESLGGATPSGTALLSAVECKPYGLVFSKPVSLIYTLYQAEIPGTPVELGLYDAIQKKIIPTGQTSTVPADGYNVTFSVMHFSTYAALANLIPQNTPIGAGVKIPLPDMLTGAFGHSIPITVAPGRKGMQPNISLAYRSSNANSWVGLGFSLNPGYIVRSTRLGPPTYTDTQDTFYFITDAGTTELVWLIDNLYQAKIESSFAKFYKEADDSWRIVGKDGSVLYFGKSSESKEGSAQGTFAWYLTKAKDTNGNYIDFSYTKDQGKSYLSRIDYTGNEAGISPTNSVEFFTETRTDISSSYISSAKIATAKRLKEVQVKVNSSLAWRYVLEYNYSPDTNRSLLKSITQSGSDGKSLPTQNLTYQQSK